MTRLQQVLLFTLATSVTVAGGYELSRGYERVRRARALVSQRHRYESNPGVVHQAREIAQEAWRGPASLPAAPVISESVSGYDPAAMEELKREGIDIAFVDEIRTLMRIALTAGDPAVKMKMAADLKRRFGLDPDSVLLAKLERAGGGPKLTLLERGKRLVRGITDAVGGMYDRLLKEVDL